jgi:nitroimidazol reductase NimA-like FMN-containing flavoprotein (pyridoxamine 5'-phosphate oxidase superfamily)
MGADRDSLDGGELEVLEHDECFRLLATMEVGRIAITVEPGTAPVVVPVNFVLDERTVVIRSDPGSTTFGALIGPVSFQVDLIDPFHRTGWSVLVRGPIEELAVEDIAHLSLTPWAAGAKHRWLRVVPTAVSGRRLHLPAIVVGDDRGYR